MGYAYQIMPKYIPYNNMGVSRIGMMTIQRFKMHLTVHLYIILPTISDKSSGCNLGLEGLCYYILKEL